MLASSIMSTIRLERCPSDKGWPRLKCPYQVTTSVHDRTGWPVEIRQLPSPWINGHAPNDFGDWLVFPEERSEEAYHERACVVCGEHMDGAIVFGSAVVGRRETAGPGGHPRCLWLAANSCPNLLDSEKTVVAWLYVGSGRGHTSLMADEGYGEPYEDGLQEIDSSATPLTRSELRALAKADPLGILVGRVA